MQSLYFSSRLQRLRNFSRDVTIVTQLCKGVLLRTDELNATQSMTSCFNMVNCAMHVNFRTIKTTLTSYAERMYTDKHEWVLIDGKMGTVGISHYAQDALGDVVYAQLPDIDTEILKKDECGALESVKAASELYSPVSGRVVEKNIAVEETPALINQSCYEKGWLFKIELKNPDELKELMTESEYENFLKTDAH
ncbi:glycine cleavage system H protein, mitochondrial isoform X1 [Zootermopsis nevadensis]|uniref:glycine cleavage system H protein, mitochondrial isoform X1 n=1 Tax=Zootermopsis nevadensis TaxID=136037 RepID=UPI000B8E5B57|nr:glycine cleavage system H protein, mitochondrial isoform X1 [Zootermopsis nevadensis]